MLNRSMPSTAGATIGISPARAVDEAFQRSVSLRRRTQFSTLKKSIPDVERFAQARSLRSRSLFASSVHFSRHLLLPEREVASHVAFLQGGLRPIRRIMSGCQKGHLDECILNMIYWMHEIIYAGEN